jgi:hypothetical protein
MRYYDIIAYSPEWGGYFDGFGYEARREDAIALEDGTIRYMKSSREYSDLVFKPRRIYAA